TDATDHDRKTHRAGAVSRRRVGRDAGGKTRQPDGANAGDVADEAVGDEADDAAVLHHAEEEIAGDGSPVIAAGGAENDGPGSGDRLRAEGGEVVGGAGISGHRNAAESALFPDRLDAAGERATASEGVDDIARRKPGKERNFAGLRAREASTNPEKRCTFDH